VTVELVIPTYNNLGQLERCLASIERQTVVPDVVHVCVDGSTDGTTAHLAAIDPAFRVLVHEHPNGEHRGRSATRNLPLGSLAMDHVVFVDSDMELDESTIESHVAVLSASPCVSVGSVVYKNAASNLWARYLMTRGRNRWADGVRLPYRQFATANAGLRADDLRRVGGFDERFEGYGGEDVEFACRLEQVTGSPFVNTTRAVARTTETKTLDQALAQFRAFGAGNLHLMMDLHPDAPAMFHTDRVASAKVGDRLFMAVMNPLTDRVADVLVDHAPFRIQRSVINYQVIRAVLSGYQSAPA
jgi:glycosyltransferase involved in cell wall biosynthesis